MTKYSVVIPVYRTEDYLSACVDSVLAQDTTSKYEILLIDDGSPDGCGKICDDYAAQYENIRVFHVENGGVSRARNLGIVHSEGEYVLLLDSDDVWESNYLSQLDTITECRPDMALVGFGRLCIDGKKAPCSLPLTPEGERGAEYLKRLFQIRRIPCFYSCCYAYKRTFLRQNELYFREDMKVSEDFEQIMRALDLAGCVTGCDKPLYNYRVRGDSATAKLSSQKLMDNLTAKAEYFRKYPVAAMADLYADNALLITRLSKKERSAAKVFLKQNRDIWRHVSQPPLKLGRILVSLFGDERGTAVYHWIRKTSGFLKRK